MRQVPLPNGITLALREHDFTDPWEPAPVLLMLHGTSESGEAFRQWVPTLARHFRLVVPDLRGMGESTRIPAGGALDMDDLLGDIVALMQALGIPRYYVVGEKVGALLALRLASRQTQRVLGVAVACGMIAPRDVIGQWAPDWIRMVEAGGPRAWVDATQAGRMGDELPPRALAWWSDHMAGQDRDSLIAYLRMLQHFALAHDELRAIRAPTLFLMPSGKLPEGKTFEQRRPASELLEWQRLVPRFEIADIDSTSYHLAATRPDACAAACRDFLRRIAASPSPERAP